jgi:hypothetical protein
MKIKKLIAIIIAVVTVVTLGACSGKNTAVQSPDGINKLSFKAAMSYKNLKELDGQTVTINGYLATSSPADGSFIFLMNLPYQSCPFCKPNTSELSNTLEVYPKENERFDYTNQAVKVTGKLEVAPSEKEAFTDQYGYEFNFKIVDADYKILKADELGENYALWAKIAESDIVNEIYKMYDYLYFVCEWDKCYVDSWTDEEGSHSGFYLFDSDAKHHLWDKDGQYHYAAEDGYFEGIISKINAVDPEAFSDLTENVAKCKTLSEKAIKELENGNYTYEEKYLEKFGHEDLVYHLNKSDELTAEYDALYYEFANWLGSWEM